MTASALPPASRIRSLDILRGLACVLMAIDHVRVYSGIPAGGPTPAIFLTRWVTHFVAPWFCLLAGAGAFLLGRKLGEPRALARFLATRGLLLVALEVTVIRLAWTFSLDYSTFVLAGVIWMLGWCMVLLAPFAFTSAKLVGWLGVAVVALQQLFAQVPALLPASVGSVPGRFWEFIYPAGAEPPGNMAVLYVIVPWIGVMMAGYGFGLILDRAPEARSRLAFRIGAALTLAFIVATLVHAVWFDDPSRPLLARLLGARKYPASPMFLLMTLGPGLMLLAPMERARGRVADALDTFGRVPMFYYLLHIPAIHLAGVLVMMARGTFETRWYATAPYTAVPPEARWPLWLLYAVWASVVLGVLYPACRWYASYKSSHRGGWLRYI